MAVSKDRRHWSQKAEKRAAAASDRERERKSESAARWGAEGAGWVGRAAAWAAGACARAGEVSGVARQNRTRESAVASWRGEARAKRAWLSTQEVSRRKPAARAEAGTAWARRRVEGGKGASCHGRRPKEGERLARHAHAKPTP
jgi:hypothetical protein